MSPQDSMNEPCPLAATAWGVVVGSATDQDREELTAHLLQGCPACGAELRRAREVVGDLDLVVAERTLAQGRASALPTSVKERLFAGLEPSEGDVPRDVDAGTGPETGTGTGTGTPQLPGPLFQSSHAEGIFVLPSSDEDWQPSGLPGIHVKWLTDGAAHERRAVLVRFDPGAAFPPHRHSMREECIVLEGRLTFGDETMKPGDYQVAEAGTIHPLQVSEEGCLVLVLAPTDVDFV